ncbi:hypothetical protein RSOL_429400 [Rhizoctonia solani AG-3 Rhs1AP]|uniref:Uncharacterized protein n=2 Tax=Rhizoctonia solani AG-3 TaxID=1086053 RepID=A0A074S8A9_9AGAM|nr:hypothetical protein RSOL_429400 [Rhizoctonia solani AG-3 Rhs1AP]KEP53830.1 hypothetical protein V565_025790 [Rhizoctonia solani 123E]
MPAVPATYYGGYLQGPRVRSEAPDYSTLQNFQWMADLVSNKIIHQQAQASRHTEHHIYYHFIPMEPGAPIDSPSRTPRSLFSSPNWSNASSVESSPESRPTRLGTQRTSRTSVGTRRGAVSYNPPPPAYNAEPVQLEHTQRRRTQTPPAQVQVESSDFQAQHAYTPVTCTQAHIEPERVLTPKEFIQELQCLLTRGRGSQSPVDRFRIQGEEIPVSVWRPDQNGPFLVQHYSPNGQEDAISVAHIVNGGGIMWCPPPNAERF